MTSTTLEHSSWTGAGGDAAARDTYASVQAALSDITEYRSLDIFLQGSYANSTNIRDDSDVDIVVMSSRTFHSDKGALSANARALYESIYSDATYFAQNLRGEVTNALVTYYGAGRIHPRNKCIRVDAAPGYVDADVVPCFQYRLYTRPDPDLRSEFIEGIIITPADGSTRIVNYPKRHIANGRVKNNNCMGRFKETVRQVKRLRNRAVDEGRLREGVAPGYLLECMVSNVPNAEFVASDSDRLSNIVLELRHSDKTGYWSCDGVHRLFQDDPGGFDVGTAQHIANALWETY